MVIVHIITSLKRGGRERQLSIIAKHSLEFKNIIVYFNEANVDYISEYKLNDVSFHVRSEGFFARVYQTYKICKKCRANVIVTWGTLETVFGMLVSILLTIPLVNYSIRHGIRKNQLSHWFRTVLLHLSKYVVANSKAGLKANNLSKGIVIYNGVENIQKSISFKAKTIEQERLFGLKDHIFLISVANLVPYKDYNTILRTLCELKKITDKFYYIIVGDGPSRKAIENYIVENDLSKNVMLTGAIQNVDDYLKLSNVMVHSSLGEGCSNAILEGMKNGLPIVASNVGGIPEILEPEYGMLFDYQDYLGLLNCLEQFIDNQELAESMGNMALIYTKKRFSVNKMISEFEKVVHAILVKDKKEIKSMYIKVR